MKRDLACLAGALVLLLPMCVTEPALAQKPGGTLRVHALDSPPSLSMHEEVDANPARDPAVLLIDQLKEVFIDGELEIIETALWYPRMYRKEFKIGLQPHRRRCRRS